MTSKKRERHTHTHTDTKTWTGRRLASDKTSRETIKETGRQTNGEKRVK